MKRVFFLCLAILVLCLPMVAQAADFGDRTKDMAEVTGVRIGDGVDKTRIVVDVDKKVTFKQMILSNPDRVVVDIPNAWISPKAKLTKSVDSRFVGKVRVAQFDPTTVRIVVETKVGKNNYKVFKLDGGEKPGRVVLDFGNLGPDTTNTTIALPDVKKPTTKPATKPAAKPATKPAEQKTPPAEEKKTPAAEKKPEPVTTQKDEDQKGDDDPDISAITGMKGKVITIDPGHGGNDSGAIGPTGIMEKSVTLRIAKELVQLLRAEGATVYMTRTGDTEVAANGANATDIEELQARCDVANSHNSDIFVSIHMDSFSSGEAHGTTGYYYTKGSKNSERLADKIRQGVIDQIGTSSRGTQGANFYVIKHTDMPATLVEVAFISNPQEEKLLDSEDGVKKAAQGIADGIADYFG